jgi:hypothetical protein
VTFSPALKWFVALLLPLTLAWKFSLKVDDSTQLKSRIVTFLADQKFAVDEAQELNGMPVIRGSSGSCRILVMRASPDGWNRDIIRDMAAGTDRVFIVFRGKIYDDTVRWATLVGYLQSEVLYRLGLAPHERAVIAVVAPAACNADRLPWDQFQDY